MSKSEQILMHGERAVAELDLALSADNRAAADSHLRLSSLHFERAQELRGGTVRRLRLVKG